jgi:integrase
VQAKKVAGSTHLLPGLGDVRLDAPDLRARVEAFKADALKKGLARKTVNNAVGYLGRALRLAEEWGLIQRAPRLKALTVTRGEPAFLDFAQAGRLLAACEPEWRPLVLVLLRTGLRIGEALALTWGDVDLKAGTIRVRATRWAGQEYAPKSGRGRTVPLTHETLAELKRLPGRKGYVFAHEDGRPFTHSEVKAVVPRACKRARGPRVTAHGLRHTYASRLVMREVPLAVVKELLGHADLTMVARYAHLAPAEAAAAVQVLDRRR